MGVEPTTISFQGHCSNNWVTKARSTVLVLKVCTHLNITSGICAGRPPQGGFITSLQSFAPVDNRESITPLNENILYCQQVLLFGTIFIPKCPLYCQSLSSPTKTTCHLMFCGCNIWTGRLWWGPYLKQVTIKKTLSVGEEPSAQTCLLLAMLES